MTLHAGPAEPDATRAALLASLERQRSHVVGILEGLSDPQLREPRLPSGWSCAGLVQHLTLDVEHYWFTCIMGGASLGFFDAWQGDSTHAWHVGAELPGEEVLDRYRAETEASNRAIASISLDDPPRQRDEWWGAWQVPDLRFVLLHVVTETACHAGHLDAARELIDGRQWLTL